MTDVGGYVLCCPDKFRGSLDAPGAARALADGVESAGPRAVPLALADGGEGTLETVLAAVGGRLIDSRAPDAIGRERPVQLGILPDGTALVEMAQAAGLATLAVHERDAMLTSTEGVGVMIGEALARSSGRVIVTVGGTATMDGGLGALRALGARLLDQSGRELRGCGADLRNLAVIDTRGLDFEPGAIEVALDAWCPVHGAGGTAEVFGPQKGASRQEIRDLDAGFAALADLLQLSPHGRDRFGTGGAFAASFAAVAGARVRSGADFVREVIGFDDELAGAALCVTGEGRVDGQSGLGKTTQGVVKAARHRGVPVVVVGGAVDSGAACLYENGAAAVLPIGRQPRSWSEARANTADDLRWIGRGIGSFLRAVSWMSQGPSHQLPPLCAAPPDALAGAQARLG